MNEHEKMTDKIGELLERFDAILEDMKNDSEEEREALMLQATSVSELLNKLKTKWDSLSPSAQKVMLPRATIALESMLSDCDYLERIRGSKG